MMIQVIPCAFSSLLFCAMASVAEGSSLLRQLDNCVFMVA